MSLIASPRHNRFWVQVLAGVGLVAVLGYGDRTLAQSAIPIPVPRPAHSTPRSTPSREAAQQFLFVNPMVGNDANNGSTQRSPFRSLTHALKVAQPNSTIMLAEGIYSADTGETFPLMIPAGVQIQGEPSTKGKSTVIEGGGSFMTATMGRQNVAIVSAGQIIGVTVSNANLNGYGLWIESGSPVIANNTFTGSDLAGVAVMADSTPTLRGNQFSQNRTGLVVAETAQPTLRNNQGESGTVAQRPVRPTQTASRQASAQAGQASAQAGQASAQASLFVPSSRTASTSQLITAPPPAAQTQSRRSPQRSTAVNLPVPQPTQVAELRRDLPVSRATPISVPAPALAFSPPPAGDGIQSNLLPVPAEPPLGHVGDLPTVSVSRNPLQSRESTSRQSAAARGLRYRVVVAGSASRVRSLFPNAFTTYSGGESVLQVGAFGDRANAEEAAQILDSNGLRAVIETLDN
jgi:parallel beta-helix repeat protein